MAVHGLLLAAVDAGLGALFYGLFDHEAAVLAALGVPGRVPRPGRRGAGMAGARRARTLGRAAAAGAAATSSTAADGDAGHT